MKNKDLSSERREYQQDILNREQLPQSPFELFKSWMQEMLQSSALDPTAMILATTDRDYQPFQRTVLLKGQSDAGFVFFTNLQSHKAKQIQANAQVSLLFPWMQLDRQVIVTGQASLLSSEENKTYFASRPVESQLAAWASKQSQVITSRQELEEAYESCQKKFADQKIDVPDFWGGYCVLPMQIEFWQGREHRLHDRFVYSRQSTDSDWQIERLAP